MKQIWSKVTKLFRRRTVRVHVTYTGTMKVEVIEESSNSTMEQLGVTKERGEVIYEELHGLMHDNNMGRVIALSKMSGLVHPNELVAATLMADHIKQKCGGEQKSIDGKTHTSANVKMITDLSELPEEVRNEILRQLLGGKL